ncbi:hypothetical protein [Clostridium cochlearium]|uniref:hypothetical protein n=1 Tax=Clostridium cochlearium TaxID=1494 RepID=UPI000B9468E7|nr:hypothetical protein [Clostridium cochlearium]MBE6064216.1 hypothetical protein [Clostridium cochlearium]MCR1972364.1 hypothetical protein [Clostridium cochlearium]MDU1442413.1 hypothetical protein [Clostridium cochlearium]SNV74312.1 Uncharacterised protein [Clostridium cochlearium]STA92289.1 Uncharacterised protein [Clostridium cochlearium]
MEELIEVLQEIRNGINDMNFNIEQLKESVEELKGIGVYNSISDVCDKLDDVYSSVTSIEIDMP